MSLVLALSFWYWVALFWYFVGLRCNFDFSFWCHLSEWIVTFWADEYGILIFNLSFFFLLLQKNVFMVWRVVWDPPFNLGPPSNSVLQGPSFQPLSINLQKVWTSPSINNIPPIWPSLLFIFFPNPPLLARLFRQYCPNEIQESYFSTFRRLKNNIKCFFYNQ